jgi:SnoaL-like domain
MQSQHYAAADLAALGREWISAWNSHDLERILALYAEDAEMTSDKIQALGLDPGGTLRGKRACGCTGARRFSFCPTCISI